jgi:hypothetical protein
MSRLVDDRTLEEWRQLDALFVLDKLGCYAKRDVSFRPVKASKTARYHVNANGRDWELLLTGPKFWDSRAGKGGGGALDLAMHLFALDFKRALLMLRTALIEAPSEPANNPAADHPLRGTSSHFAGTEDGPA